MSTKRDQFEREEATILPPPGNLCNFTLKPDAPPTTHSLFRDGLPSADCEIAECVVDAVHDR